MPMERDTQLPSPIEVFTPDPHAVRFARIQAIEDACIFEHGHHHAPDSQGSLMYFANPTDARVQRRWYAKRIVANEERFAAAVHEPHGAVLPSLRELAEHQLAEYERTGRVTVTGVEVT